MLLSAHPKKNSGYAPVKCKGIVLERQKFISDGWKKLTPKVNFFVLLEGGEQYLIRSPAFNIFPKVLFILYRKILQVLSKHYKYEYSLHGSNRRIIYYN